MPLNARGEIVYSNAQHGGVRYQVDPPVCNRCHQTITQENFGWMFLEGSGRLQGPFEFIECRGCTLMRASGASLRRFLERHHLLREPRVVSSP
jgi:hypothetical protein